MSEGKKPSQPKQRWIPARDGSFIEIYGNFAHASWTLFDVRIKVGHLIPSEESPDPIDDKDSLNPKGFVIEQLAAITIAWPQAKYLRDVLTRLVASYEEVNGEIKPLKLPPDPTTPPDSAG